MEKMTKIEMFQQVSEIVGQAEIAPELKKYLLHQLEFEIDVVARRNISRRNAAQKKRDEENAPIKRAILDVLSNAGETVYLKASDIRDMSPELKLVSTPKVSAVLKRMITDGDVVRIMEENGTKKIYTYSLA